MSNSSQWVLVKRFAEVAGYSDSTVRHKVENCTGMGGAVTTFHVCGSRRRHPRGGTA